MQGMWVQFLVGELRSHMLKSNQACVLQLLSLRAVEPLHHNQRFCVPQQDSWHDAMKILCAATKTRCSQINKIKQFFKNHRHWLGLVFPTSLFHHSFCSPIWMYTFSFLMMLIFKYHYGLSGKESPSQRKRHRFNLWVGKIPWSRKWQPTPLFLPGKFYGQRNLVDSSPWGHERVRHDSACARTHTYAHTWTHTHSTNSLI